jgi:hypothetical protein
MTKSTEQCSVDEWAKETREAIDEYVAAVKRNSEGHYPETMLPGEWDEDFMCWEGE